MENKTGKYCIIKLEDDYYEVNGLLVQAVLENDELIIQNAIKMHQSDKKRLYDFIISDRKKPIKSTYSDR